MHSRNNIIPTTNRKRDKEQRKEERLSAAVAGSGETVGGLLKTFSGSMPRVEHRAWGRRAAVR
jgi:hypothetical protein